MFSVQRYNIKLISNHKSLIFLLRDLEGERKGGKGRGPANVLDIFMGGGHLVGL